MMTEDQMAQAEQDAACMAVAHALTAAERERFFAGVRGMDGADVADILAEAVDRDMLVNDTDEFYEAHPGALPDIPARAYAVHALLIMRRPLTVPAVLGLLYRAGAVDAPAPGTSAVTAEVAAALDAEWKWVSGGRSPLASWIPEKLAQAAIRQLAVIRDRDGIDPLGG
jgi:hypothetical protein